MDDFNYCILDTSYKTVQVFTKKNCAELQIASTRVSLLYRLSLFITSMLAIIE